MDAYQYQIDQRFNGPSLISFDGDQTLYSDGENFEKNPKLAYYLYQLLRCGVHVAVVTAAGYEYQVEKYEYRLSGLLQYFKARGLTEDECNRFYLFGGECNYLMQLSGDFRLEPVKEYGPGGWLTSSKFIAESPANWIETEINTLLDVAETQFTTTMEELNLRGQVIRKRRAVGLIPSPGREIPRESLDEAILRAHEALGKLNYGNGTLLPFCAFNGGNDCWVDVGNKRVGVRILQAYLGIPNDETLHIGDQFLNTGNDFAARSVAPCVWITNPVETMYILKSILRLAGISVAPFDQFERDDTVSDNALSADNPSDQKESAIDFQELERRAEAAKRMNVYTGDFSTP
jgi:IMP and pyridine-specific 5'-nucleotidase